MDQINRMKQLVEELNEASLHYYAKGEELMNNYEYDKKYDELEKLENELDLILSNSPTIRIGYEVLSNLPKEAHEKPMLSLSKTKDKEELTNWLGNQKGILSWKLDGLTIVLTYQNGKLIKAVTRGNGEVGEVITNNAKTFINLPTSIPYKGELIIRGEAVISYSNFEKINSLIENMEDQYKNPRNLCSGSVRQLNNQITAERKVELHAFSLVEAKGYDFHNSRAEQFAFMKSQGFDVVDYQLVDQHTILDAIDQFANKIQGFDIPSDGLVLVYEDLEYSASLGRTAKAPKDSIAFKWADELAETTLRYIEWSPSRTGLINPVAVFDTVSLEGTNVSRASVHNLSVIESLELGVGDHITVYKANMIIPQIANNLTRSNTIQPPENCPICDGKTEVRSFNEAKVLYCINPECPVKKNKAFSLFVSRDALNIEGLSESTLEKLIQKGFLHSLEDIFCLSKYQKEISEMDRFGEKSTVNLLQAIEQSKHTTLAKLIYGLGIANIGVANAKLIVKFFKNDPIKLKQATKEELLSIDGIGEVIANAYVSYFAEERKTKEYDALLEVLDFEDGMDAQTDLTLDGVTVVITGSLNQFNDRSEMKEAIENLGGKVTGSVSKNTDYLINNDVESSSSKNKKAKELQVTIITEDEFIRRFL